MNCLYDVFMELENHVCNLTDSEWKELDDIASDIHKTVSIMTNYMQSTINKFDKGEHNND